MQLSDWFNFSGRVKHEMVMVKIVDNHEVIKYVHGSFNWLAALLTWFYALFSSKYKTRGFAGKVAVPFIFLWVINMVTVDVLSDISYAILMVLEFVWFGLMFDTWFAKQLLSNGYQVKTDAVQDFE